MEPRAASGGKKALERGGGMAGGSNIRQVDTSGRLLTMHT